MEECWSSDKLLGLEDGMDCEERLVKLVVMEVDEGVDELPVVGWL